MNGGHKKARVGARAIEVLQMSLQSVLGLKNGGNPAKGEEVLKTMEKQVNHLLDLPKRVGYGFERVKVTPDLATYYLSFNRNNCKINQKRVNAYADEMLRGEWMENGDTIVFSKTARLIDGQKRLLAVQKSGISIFTLVVYGAEEDSQFTKDTGDRKGATWVVGTAGLSGWEAKTLGTALHAAANRQKGLPLSSSVRRLNRELDDFYLEHESRLLASLRLVSEFPRRAPPIPHSVAVSLHFCFAEKDTASADDFITKLFTGESLAKSNPVYQLREKLSEAQRIGSPLSLRQQVHACIKAWNCCRAHKSLSSPRTLLPRSDEPLAEIE